jgi:proteasome lid subunit RPN8/RPN11
MSRLVVPCSIVEATLAPLREAGEARRECVVLWLGRRVDDGIHVVAVHEPVQEASEDHFYIPRESIVALLGRLSREGLMVVAQVHTHPEEAFHSAADDRWAIVRHEGALSLVLPHFALSTDATTFWRDVAIFVLMATNRWRELRRHERHLHLAEQS